MTGTRFLLVVITSPAAIPGEADYLEGLLEAGLEKLHIRKPADRQEERAPRNSGDIRTPEGRLALLERLAPRWHSRLVLHGDRGVVPLAKQYRVPQVHGHWHRPWIENGHSSMGLEEGRNPMGREKGLGMQDGRPPALSASLHSWEEVHEVPPRALEYVFLSPLFDSISKPGYLAGEGLLRRPAGVAPCGLIGLGGIDADNIGEVIQHGWDGAALLGYIWQHPEKAVERFRKLKEIASRYGK
ncbi:MAG TPA: thiamine phosphate synthase [Puia sp.]|nr:thiamine phosphate synthase [Puia sp.]